MMVEIKLKPKVLWRENFRQTDKQIDKQNLTVANFNIDPGGTLVWELRVGTQII